MVNVVNIKNNVVSAASYRRARELVTNNHESFGTGRAAQGNVLSALQQLTPNLNISTNMQPFSSFGGSMNLGIHPAMLRKASDNPEEMVRLKALVMEDAVIIRPTQKP